MHQGKTDITRYCPQCKGKMDAFTNPSGDRSPEVGDYCVCAACATLLRYTETSFDLVTEEELLSLPQEMQAQLRYQRFALGVLISVPKDAPFPPAYYLDAELMYLGARQWFRDHPCAHVTFNKLPEKVAYIASLDDAGIELLACNEQARDLLKYMDTACRSRGTVLQAQAAIEKLLGEMNPSNTEA